MSTYRIHLKGHLDLTWSAWLERMELIHRPDGTTELVGVIADQASLFGLLAKLRDLGQTLLSVEQIELDNE